MEQSTRTWCRKSWKQGARRAQQEKKKKKEFVLETVRACIIYLVPVAHDGGTVCFASSWVDGAAWGPVVIHLAIVRVIRGQSRLLRTQGLAQIRACAQKVSIGRLRDKCVAPFTRLVTDACAILLVKVDHNVAALLQRRISPRAPLNQQRQVVVVDAGRRRQDANRQERGRRQARQVRGQRMRRVRRKRRGRQRCRRVRRR